MTELLWIFVFIWTIYIWVFSLSSREARVHCWGVGNTWQWRFHCTGAQQQNSQHQELLSEKERDQVGPHTHAHTFLDVLFDFLEVKRTAHVRVRPGLLPGPVRVGFTTLMRTSVTPIMEPCSPKAPHSQRNPLRCLSQRYLSLHLSVSLSVI